MSNQHQKNQLFSINYIIRRSNQSSFGTVSVSTLNKNKLKKKHIWIMKTFKIFTAIGLNEVHSNVFGLNGYIYTHKKKRIAGYAPIKSCQELFKHL